MTHTPVNTFINSYNEKTNVFDKNEDDSYLDELKKLELPTRAVSLFNYLAKNCADLKKNLSQIAEALGWGQAITYRRMKDLIDRGLIIRTQYRDRNGCFSKAFYAFNNPKREFSCEKLREKLLDYVFKAFRANESISILNSAKGMSSVFYDVYRKKKEDVKSFTKKALNSLKTPSKLNSLSNSLNKKVDSLVESQFLKSKMAEVPLEDIKKIDKELRNYKKSLKGDSFKSRILEHTRSHAKLVENVDNIEKSSIKEKVQCIIKLSNSEKSLRQLFIEEIIKEELEKLSNDQIDKLVKKSKRKNWTDKKNYKTIKNFLSYRKKKRYQNTDLFLSWERWIDDEITEDDDIRAASSDNNDDKPIEKVDTFTVTVFHASNDRASQYGADIKNHCNPDILYSWFAGSEFIIDEQNKCVEIKMTKRFSAITVAQNEYRPTTRLVDIPKFKGFEMHTSCKGNKHRVND